MMPIDLHPEELLDRARQGVATQEELERLREHLASCKACSFVRALARDSDREPEPEAEAVRRIAGSSVNAFLGRAAGERRRTGIARRFALAAVATACIATAAAAAILVRRSVSLSDPPREPEAVPARSTALEHPRPQPAVEAPPPSAAPAPAQNTSRIPPLAGSRSDKPAPSSNSSSPSAAELFALANAERRRGELSRAVEHYRELEQVFRILRGAGIARRARQTAARSPGQPGRCAGRVRQLSRTVEPWSAARRGVDRSGSRPRPARKARGGTRCLAGVADRVSELGVCWARA